MRVPLKTNFCKIRGRFILFISCMVTIFLCSTAESFRLPDSGQAKCFQGVAPYNEIPCAGTGQDGAYNLNPMNFTDNGDGTVTDNNTNLMWQKEDDSSTYNWYQSGGTFDAEYNPSSQNVCGSLALGGYSDWRLPSKKELMTIVDYSETYPGLTIDTTYFPNTKSYYYWSSTTSAGYPGSAWYVHFSCGYLYDLLKDYGNCVRCVRGEQIPDPVFIDNGNGTVTDNRTGLIWQQGEPGYMTWDSALSYCEGLSLGGHSDWRLPNIKELESITDNARWNPAIDTSYFPEAPASSYWSSTTNANYPYNAWHVLFFGGFVDKSLNKGDSIYVRCVRCSVLGKPVLISPLNGATGISTTPALDWVDVSGASSYKIQVCTDSSCLSMVQTAALTESEWILTSALNPGKTFYWRVKAVNDCSSSPWSNIRSFTTACPTLDVPSLISPPNGTVGVSITPTLDWDDVSVATSYKVQVCSDIGCLNIVASVLTPSSQWTVTSALSPTTTYYWRAKAKNSCGSSMWSEVRSFKTKPTITVVSPNGSPSQENWQAGTTQTIQWTYTGNAGTYVKIELFKSGVLNRTITPSTSIGSSGTGSCNWAIKPTQQTGCDYKIKIRNTTNSSVGDKSDKPFCVYQ